MYAELGRQMSFSGMVSLAGSSVSGLELTYAFGRGKGRVDTRGDDS